MELEELKSLWSEYDKKLDKSLQLNMQLLRKMNFDKAHFKLKTVFVWKIAEMIGLMYLLQHVISFTIQYFAQPQFSIAGILLWGMILGFFIYDIMQISVMLQLQLKSKEEAITTLQARIQTLKTMFVTHVKYTFLLIPLYPAGMIVIGKMFLHIDFFSVHLKTYMISNIAVGVLLLIPYSWLFKELSKKEIKKVWVDNLLWGSGWHSANDAVEFLSEIEKAEGEI